MAGGVSFLYSLVRVRPPPYHGKPKSWPGAGDAIHLAGRNIVAHAVDLIVVGPERLVLRIEVHADRVAQSDRIDLAVLAVTVHADDSADAELAVGVELLLRRHVVGLPKLDIELVVRSHPAHPRGVIVALIRLRNQLAFRNDVAGDDIRALIEELGRRIFQHPILLGDVEEAVLREAYAVGYLLRQRRRELLHLVSHAAARAVGHHPDFRFARADKGRDALRADRDVAGIRHQRVQRNVEARRQFDLGQILLDLIGLRAGLRDFGPIDGLPVWCMAPSVSSALDGAG